MTTPTIVRWMQSRGMTTEARHFSRDGKNAASIRKYFKVFQNTCKYCFHVVKDGDYCAIHTYENELQRIARTRVVVRVPFQTGRTHRTDKKRRTKNWFMRRIKNGRRQHQGDPYSSDDDSEEDGSDTDILSSDDESSDDESGLGLGESKRERKSSSGREEKGEPDVVVAPRGRNKRERSESEPRTSRRRRNSVNYTEIPEDFDSD